MKISNKFFFGALIAASIALVGCNQDAAGDADMIKVVGANASIEEYNASEDGIQNKRGFKTIKGTKWKQGIYKITFENPEDSGDSVMGLIFDEYEKDDLYNFYCFGLKVNSAKNGLACYLSYFPNVKSENLSSDSGTFYPINESEEVEIIKGVKTDTSRGAYLDLGTVEEDENGNVLSTKTMTGKVGDSYTTTAETFDASSVSTSSAILRSPRSTFLSTATSCIKALYPISSALRT